MDGWMRYVGIVLFHVEHDARADALGDLLSSARVERGAKDSATAIPAHIPSCIPIHRARNNGTHHNC
jgi:hypothetical protein